MSSLLLPMIVISSSFFGINFNEYHLIKNNNGVRIKIIFAIILVRYSVKLYVPSMIELL